MDEKYRGIFVPNSPPSPPLNQPGLAKSICDKIENASRDDILQVVQEVSNSIGFWSTEKRYETPYIVNMVRKALAGEIGVEYVTSSFGLQDKIKAIRHDMAGVTPVY